jgi:hypothetical protein
MYTLTVNTINIPVVEGAMANIRCDNEKQFSF